MDQEIIQIIKKFAESGWNVIDEPSKAWLKSTEELLSAVRKADGECGSCGCEFDALYKKVICYLTEGEQA